MKNHHLLLFIFFVAFLFLIPDLASGVCECGGEEEERDKPAALKLKYIGIASISVASATGIFIPLLGRHFSVFRPENDIFFAIKSFAAGVILATAMIHMLPEAMEKLTSPCLKENPWEKFPFSGFMTMMAALLTLLIDNLARSYYGGAHLSKAQPVNDGDEEARTSHVHVHGHTHGHGHGVACSTDGDSLRHRIVSQVLEMGIVFHSIIIGITLGTSEDPSTIRPLIGALSFHQFFEGIGLGGCIVQARFSVKTTIIMVMFFCLTTPVGVGVGIGIASSYDENSPKALIVEGILDAASAGILIYMSLVDLLAEDFGNPRLQTNGRLQLFCYAAMFVGAGLMSLVGKWA